MHNVADMADIFDIWGGFGFIKNGKEVPTKNAVAALIRIYGNCILYFYKAFVAIVKKKSILQRWISGPGWKPGSREGIDGQGQ